MTIDRKLTEDEFIARFKPVLNPIDPDDGFDGCLFYVGAQDPNLVRTELDCDGQRSRRRLRQGDKHHDRQWRYPIRRVRCGRKHHDDRWRAGLIFRCDGERHDDFEWRQPIRLQQGDRYYYR